MQVGSSTTGYTPGTTYSAAAVKQADQQFAALLNSDDDPETILAKITKDGYNSLWQWQIDQLRKQAVEEVMGQMNLTPAQIAAMPSEQRADIENKIMKAVEEKVRQMIEQGMHNSKKDPLGIALSSGPAPADGIGGVLNVMI